MKLSLVVILIWLGSALSEKSFVIITEEMTWPEAFQVCDEHQMRLVTIESHQEQKQIEDMMIESYKSVLPVWIGVNLKFTPHQLIWASTGKNIYYSNWQDLVPRSDGEKFCVQLLPREPTVIDNRVATWNFTECERKLSFICEKQKYFDV